jgi:hypothetical protein
MLLIGWVSGPGAEIQDCVQARFIRHVSSSPVQRCVKVRNKLFLTMLGLFCQKRPSIVSKETSYSVKRDLE